MMAVLVAFSMLFAFTTTANAASGPVKAVQYDTIYVGSTSWGGLGFEPAKSEDWDRFDKIMDNCKLISVTSSKPKVLKAVKDGSGMYYHYLEPKKLGKAKITIKYKYKGKTYTTSKTVKVKKYPKAIKSLTVNGKKVDLSKKALRFDYDVEKYKKTSATIKIKASSGWKIDSAYIISDGLKNGYKNLKASVFKKGTSISVPKGNDGYIFITLKCTSGDNKGDNFTYAVRFFRK